MISIVQLLADFPRPHTAPSYRPQADIQNIAHTEW